MRQVVLIVNPFASGVTEERVAGVERALGSAAEVRTLLTERPGHAVELAEGACGDGVDAIVVFSGDGGYNEAANGAEAMKHFNSRSFDLVFMDQHLPGEDGVHIAVNMRAASRKRHIPIIFATGDGKVGVLEDAMDVAMADGFLRKPFSLQEFKSSVQAVLTPSLQN